MGENPPADTDTGIDRIAFYRYTVHSASKTMAPVRRIPCSGSFVDRRNRTIFEITKGEKITMIKLFLDPSTPPRLSAPADSSCESLGVAQGESQPLPFTLRFP